jgi:hypothetical protein
VEVLESVGGEVGLAVVIPVDQGAEFVSRDLDLWAYKRGVTFRESRPIAIDRSTSSIAALLPTALCDRSSLRLYA